MENIIKKLYETQNLTNSELAKLIESEDATPILSRYADSLRKKIYGNSVYIRGLIEFTNYCKNNCYYCGIRGRNALALRYRLTKEEILSCCREGYALGFRTFVLQGGEDCFFTDDILCDIVSAIHNTYPDCAITLSVGERSRESYERLYSAGARRYLLRHESALYSHYSMLHPDNMSLDNRKECLFNLKEIGYQVGTGLMVGSPYQKTENIVADFRFMQELMPDMIGVGPYINHKQTPFKDFESGSFTKTLRVVSLARLMFPYALIPSTTALGTINENGRKMGLLSGANVVMPNLSPLRVRKMYAIYDNKISTGEEAAQSLDKLTQTVESIGYKIVYDIGNAKKKEEQNG